jgi:hypothetical protein
MMIQYDKESKQFHLGNGAFSYIIKILENLYLYIGFSRFSVVILIYRKNTSNQQKLYKKVVIVEKRIEERLQSKQAFGLRGGYCLETTPPHRFIQVTGKKI